MRLLYCAHCRTLEEVPDYEGPNTVDPFVEELVRQHNVRDPMAHGGDHLPTSPMRLIAISEHDWQTNRAEVIKQVNQENKKVGFDAWVYEAVSTYEEDALKCYQEHGRPDEGRYCIDYWSDSKRIGRPTSEGRHVIAEQYKLGEWDPHLCQFCFSGETEVVTRQGTRRIDELATEGSAELLVPPTHGSWATWRQCEVRSFGKQQIMKVTLRRGKHDKIIYATPEHVWYITNEQEYRGNSHKLKNAARQTQTLSVGDLLEYGQAPPLKLYEDLAGFPVVPSAFGVAQGFVFGDGCAPLGRTLQPASVRLYGEKDKALLPYFAAAEPKLVQLHRHHSYTAETAWEVSNLPRSWKYLPDIDESKSFLLGWLAGYFAADGTVGKEGTAYLNSANREHLEFVRTVGYHLGILTGAVSSKMRVGKGRCSTALYQLWINAEDLPESFWLLEHHRLKVLARSGIRQPSHQWKVVALEQTSRVEEVFCAVVPVVEKFILADNLVTGNCPFFTVVQTGERWKKGLYRD